MDTFAYLTETGHLYVAQKPSKVISIVTMYFINYYMYIIQY